MKNGEIETKNTVIGFSVNAPTMVESYGGIGIDIKVKSNISTNSIGLHATNSNPLRVISNHGGIGIRVCASSE